MLPEESIRVPYVDLGAQWQLIRDEALDKFDQVLLSGKYLEHEIVMEVEQALSKKLGVRHVITMNSGTDALLIGLMALGIKRGDEVITVPNSFIATAAAIAHVGATPIMVDVGQDHLIDPSKIEEKITSKTVAIMPVHLEGKVCDMEAIKAIAKKYQLAIVEDAAQSMGSKYGGQESGSFGDIACFSLHPLKNLNAIGDGGFIATNDDKYRDFAMAARNHGQSERNLSIFFGNVSRLDSIQASVISIRLKALDSTILNRRQSAQMYDGALLSSGASIPMVSEKVFHSYHLYVIEVDNRDEVQRRLLAKGVETKIHYPRLITDQPAYMDRYGITKDIQVAQSQSRKILSLPIHQNLDNNQKDYLIEKLLETIEEVA
jgi:dTDP-4-amino-4,6-dideoxygalactose transaminase